MIYLCNFGTSSPPYVSTMPRVIITSLHKRFAGQS